MMSGHQRGYRISNTTLFSLCITFYLFVPAQSSKQSNPDQINSQNRSPKGICDSSTCLLPNCRCQDDSIPGSLDPQTVPQMVLLTFDDGVNIENIDYYRKIQRMNLKNPDGCPIGLTYFVSGDYTNFKFVEELYQQGHEIASHSISHKLPISWWSKATYEEFRKEMVGMRNQLNSKYSIPMDKIKGMRVPFLQLNGDTQFAVARDNNFLWDSSMLAKWSKRPIWPFTLDYKVKPDYCQIQPCPNWIYPGLCEIPLIPWRDSDGNLYGMPDENTRSGTKEEMFNFLRDNFNLHYNTSRAPLGIFIHATWFTKNVFNLKVLLDFLEYLTKKEDVWIIQVSQALDWVRNPQNTSSLSEIPSWKCSKISDQENDGKNEKSDQSIKSDEKYHQFPIRAKGICDSSTCKLPNCRCPDDSIPGSLDPQRVPQMVLLTFDDGVNIHNIDYYRKIQHLNLKNPDGCPVGMTFFVSDNNNNYQYVKELYKQGHEIASHSETHRFPMSWWSQATYRDFKYEMVGMRNLLRIKASIPEEKIKGMRVPFLRLNGDTQFQVVRDSDFTWDSTMSALWEKRPIWPFTLDYQVPPKYCQIKPCPKKTYPGLWEIPLIQWRDNYGKIYGMADENKNPLTKFEMFNFFLDNFYVHYNTSKSPLGIFIHGTWFTHKGFNMEVLQDFLKYLNQKEDVWIITVSQALDWVRNPKEISSASENPSWRCNESPKFHTLMPFQQIYLLLLILYLGKNLFESI